MVSFILKKLEEPLIQCGLYHVVRVVCYEITPSYYNFFALLEKYNPNTCTFFYPGRRNGICSAWDIRSFRAIHRDLPYEEYIPCTEELHLLKKNAPQVYEIYWEVMCHFHISAQATGWRSGRVMQMSWANYLFQGLEKSTLITPLASNTDP